MAMIGTVRGFGRDGSTHSLFPQPGAGATTVGYRKTNGLTTLAGSISGRRGAAMQFICRSESQPLSINFPSPAIVRADAQHSSAFVQDHVTNHGVGKSVAEVSPFAPRILALIHAVVGCGKNSPVVLRVDDDGVNRNVGDVAGAIAPTLAAVCRSKDVTSSKG